jgi:peptidoglycan/xylan/chitin deacetylase (PgdA/CDA1 family)
MRDIPRNPLIPDLVYERDLIGYGPNPPKFAWPGQARVAVNLVVVYEEGSEASVIWGDDHNERWGEYADPGVPAPQRDRGMEAHYEYGSRAGIWRLARIFERFEVPVTVSASAIALELNPHVPAWMREHGHDLLAHGWRWIPLWDLTREQEREHLNRAVASFTATLGEHPLGWNCPSWPSEHTRELLVEEGGFLYESDACADDIPYWVSCQGKPLLVVPYSKTYNDSRYLTTPGFGSPRDFVETMTMGLDQLLSEDRISMMTVAMHTRWSGQATRAAAIREFLEYATRIPEVSFMRRGDIARWWLEQYPPKTVA